jgi:hypothetical protein
MRTIAASSSMVCWWRWTLERLLLEVNGQYRVSDAVAGDAIFRPASFEGLEIPLVRSWTVPET